MFLEPLGFFSDIILQVRLKEILKSSGGFHSFKVMLRIHLQIHIRSGALHVVTNCGQQSCLTIRKSPWVTPLMPSW